MPSCETPRKRVSMALFWSTAAGRRPESGLPVIEGVDPLDLFTTPTTDEVRLPKVLKNASGFIYYVSILGIMDCIRTKKATREAVAYLKSHTDLLGLGGHFGIGRCRDGGDHFLAQCGRRGGRFRHRRSCPRWAGRKNGVPGPATAQNVLDFGLRARRRSERKMSWLTISCGQNSGLGQTQGCPGQSLDEM